MRVLLTGARAPVTLDLARRFALTGSEVFLCDSLKYGCATFTRHRQRAFLVPRPRTSPAQYIAALRKIVDEHRIDLLIPTCEEAFYIAAYRAQIDCEVLVDSIENLRQIHNKWTFSQTASNESATVPQTYKITSQQELRRFQRCSTNYVFKPVYSRFASRTLIAPEPRALESLDVSEESQWIAQRRIQGIEYSTYSVAHQGRLAAHVSYVSKYRAGRGSGIYFDARPSEQSLQFVRTFLETNGFTGQIGFDCIVDADERVWIIEGNPRATSGLHLFEDDVALVEALRGRQGDVVVATSGRSHMIGATMPLWGLADAARHGKLLEFPHDVLRGRDVLFRWSDPLPCLGLPITMAELVLISLRERKTLQQASTHDIEWNGETL